VVVLAVVTRMTTERRAVLDKYAANPYGGRDSVVTELLAELRAVEAENAALRAQVEAARAELETISLLPDVAPDPYHHGGLSGARAIAKEALAAITSGFASIRKDGEGWKQA